MKTAINNFIITDFLNFDYRILKTYQALAFSAKLVDEKYFFFMSLKDDCDNHSLLENDFFGSDLQFIYQKPVFDLLTEMNSHKFFPQFISKDNLLINIDDDFAGDKTKIRNQDTKKLYGFKNYEEKGASLLGLCSLLSVLSKRKNQALLINWLKYSPFGYSKNKESFKQGWHYLNFLVKLITPCIQIYILANSEVAVENFIVEIGLPYFDVNSQKIELVTIIEEMTSAFEFELSPTHYSIIFDSSLGVKKLRFYYQFDKEKYIPSKVSIAKLAIKSRLRLHFHNGIFLPLDSEISWYQAEYIKLDETTAL